MPKLTNLDKMRALRPTYSELTRAMSGDSTLPPEDIVAQVPSILLNWNRADRIEELWHLVQFIDDCLRDALNHPDGVYIFDAFASAHSRAQMFLQKEVDELPDSIKKEGLPAANVLGNGTVH